jgi:hypothetical protein
MTTHDLKIWPEYFDPLIEHRKTFELRKADRDYKEGDTLNLKEWDPKTEKYTGLEAEVEITYILGGPFVIPGMCLMSIKLLSTTNWNVAKKHGVYPVTDLEEGRHQ